MKKIFESELNLIGNDASAEKIYIYALENDNEWGDLCEMSHEERCDYFDVYEEYGVAPGAKFHRYEFDLYCSHIIICETIAYNV